jgi:hypothetical protein
MNTENTNELEKNLLKQIHWMKNYLTQKEFEIKANNQEPYKKIDLLISVAQYIERKGIHMRMFITDFSNSIDDNSLLEKTDEVVYPDYNDNLDNGTITVKLPIDWDSDLDNDGFGNGKTPFNGQAPF